MIYLKHNSFNHRGPAIVILVATLFTLPCTKIAGQVDGSLDPTFGTNGIASIGLGPTNDMAWALAVQTDGKIVSAGFAGATDSPFANDFGVVRFNPDGTPDTGFGVNGVVTTAIGTGDDQARAMAIQPNDGRIIVAGSAWIGGNWDIALVRYLPSGALDNSFGNNGKVTRSIGPGDDLGFALALQPDGKILVAGQTTNQGTVQMAVVRFNTNGTFDNGFGQNGAVVVNFGSNSALANALVIQPDLKILVGGYSGNMSSKDLAIIRLLSNGSLDTGFGLGGGVLTSIASGDDLGYGMDLHQDGRIVLCGKTENGLNDDMAIVRYTSAGALDFTFGTNGVVTYDGGAGHDVAWALAVQADDKIIVTGSTDNAATMPLALFRFSSDGALDPLFGSNGIVHSAAGFARALTLHPAGYILTSGGTSSSSNVDFMVSKHTNGPGDDPPNAGTDGTLAVCSNNAPTSLFLALQGNPDTDGTWNGPSPTTGQYDPTTMQPGNYIYTVSGEGVYPDASATVVVDEQLAPYAGTDGAVEVCSNGSAFLLFDLLGDNPNIGGLWRYSSMIFNGIFIPANSPEGVYIYIAPGFGACANDSSEVLVSMIDLTLDGIEGPDAIADVGTLIFTASPLLTDADSYTWIIPSGWTWDDAEPTDGVAYLVPPEEAGVYSICAITSGGECTGNEVCFETEVTVGIATTQGSDPFGLVVYPNPNTGSFTVRANGTLEVLHVQILNSVGGQVATFVLNGADPILDLDQFAAGTYIMHWSSAKRSGSQSIVVVH